MKKEFQAEDRDGELIHALGQLNFRVMAQMPRVRMRVGTRNKDTGGRDFKGRMQEVRG